MVNDQHMVAKRVKDMGLGIIGNFKEINTIDLRDGVMKLLTDKQIQENCENISLKFREFNHLSNVAVILEKISKWQQ